MPKGLLYRGLPGAVETRPSFALSRPTEDGSEAVSAFALLAAGNPHAILSALQRVRQPQQASSAPLPEADQRADQAVSGLLDSGADTSFTYDPTTDRLIGVNATRLVGDWRREGTPHDDAHLLRLARLTVYTTRVAAQPNIPV